MSSSSPSKRLYHYLFDNICKIFIRPDKRISVINKRDSEIIAILTSDPNERIAEISKAETDLSLSGALFKSILQFNNKNLLCLW